RAIDRHLCSGPDDSALQSVPTKEPAMALLRVQLSVLSLGASVLLATQNIDTRAEAQAAASNVRRTTAGSPITGEGLPNPAPIVTRNWGQLPAGRKWGNVWIADFAGNKDGTKGHQVHKFSPKGEKLLSLGTAGKAGNADGQFNQPNDVVVGPDGSIYVADGHDAQGMTTANAVAEGLKRGATSRISKFTADGKFIKSWGGIGIKHGEFRTPHALVFDSRGRLWVADRGNHRIEIFDQDGKYLESRYAFSRPSGIFIKGETVYVIDSESGPFNHPNWHDGVRIGPVNEDRVTGFIPPFDREDRGYQGTAGEGVAVDADGNVYAAEG